MYYNYIDIYIMNVYVQVCVHHVCTIIRNDRKRSEVTSIRINQILWFITASHTCVCKGHGRRCGK